MAIGSRPRQRARRWSQVIYETYHDAQGLRHATSMYHNATGVALFDRSEAIFPDRPLLHRAPADPLLLPALADASGNAGICAQYPIHNATQMDIAKASHAESRIT